MISEINKAEPGSPATSHSYHQNDTHQRSRSILSVKPRALIMFVLLDLITFFLSYVVIVPLLAPIIVEMSAATQFGIRIGLSLIRLGLVGFYAARTFRRRYGLPNRYSALPTVILGSLIGVGIQLVIQAFYGVAAGYDAWSWSALLLAPEWIIFAGLGALLVAPGEAGSARSQRMKRIMERELRDSGQAQAEYVGIISVVVLIIAALIIGATPIGSAIAGKICDALGVTCWSGFGVEVESQKGPPKKPCSISSERTYVEGTAKIVVDVSQTGDITKETMSDGTFRVTVSGETGVGYTFDAGTAKAELTVDGKEHSVGFKSSAGIVASGKTGRTMIFESEKDADEFISYTMRQTAANAANDVINPIGPHAPGSQSLFGSILEQGIGMVNGKGAYRPPQPREILVEGSTTLTGKVSGGVGAAGISLFGSAKVATSLGATFDLKTKKSTVYFALNLSGSAGVGVPVVADAGLTGKAAAKSSVTFDKDGGVDSLTLSFDATGGTQGSFVGLFGGTGKIDLNEQNGTRYQMSFDMKDPKQAKAAKEMAALIASGLLNPAALLVPENFDKAAGIVANAMEHGQTTEQAITSTARKLVGGEVAVGVEGIGVKLGGALGVDSKHIKESKYYSGKSGGWKNWSACSK